MEHSKPKAEGEVLNGILDDPEKSGVVPKPWETDVNVHFPRAEYGDYDLIIQPIRRVVDVDPRQRTTKTERQRESHRHI